MRTATRQPDKTTGWSSTISILVADLAEFCIITVPFRINRHFAGLKRETSATGVRIVRMWKKLSLRSRLFLPLGMMFVAALVLGAISLQLFAPDQLIDENEQATRSAKAVAEALNSALKVVDQSAADPRRVRAIARNIRDHPVSARRRGQLSSFNSRGPHAVRRVPGWFVRLLGIPDIGASFPVTIEGKAGR